jgi:16S rRNA (adenine1518-N6/adenine1519-N6)-dimethyltransferase
MDLSSLPPLREIINENDLRAEKKFGQNFLLDLNLTDKIVKQAGDLSSCHVVEIGPGPGGLTRSILKAEAKKCTAIEFDPRAVCALESLTEAAQGRLEIIHDDALNVDLDSISSAPRVIIANLPYNIATPLLIQWLEKIEQDARFVQSMTFMFQKEVAQRITAKVGDKAYGRLSVLSNWLCETKKLFDVPRHAFTPPPKVTSSIVQLIPKQRDGEQPSFKAVEKITAAAFGQRRKMIRSSLKDYAQHFDETGLDETMRAENITPDKYINLATKARL